MNALRKPRCYPSFTLREIAAAMLSQFLLDDIAAVTEKNESFRIFIK